MAVTPAGIVTSLRLEQPWKMVPLMFMLLALAGRCRVVRAVQPVKSPQLMLRVSQSSANVTDVRFGHFWNTPPSSLVMVFGSETVSMLLFSWKAPPMRLVTVYSVPL